MLQTNLSVIFRKDLILHLAINSFVLTLLLAFIDEGAYNFNWMNDTGSWGALFVYFGIIYLIQLLVFKLALRNFEKLGKIVSYVAVVSAIVIMISLGLSN